MPVTATYAGLRPASEKKEYRIRQVDGRNWISVGGIRSTGLTAALGIARHVYRLYQGGRFHEAVREPLWPQVPNLAEHLPRATGSVPATTRSSATARWSPAGKSSPPWKARCQPATSAA